MFTRRLTIKEVTREHPIYIVEPTDFATEPAGEIDPIEVLKDPKFTLYCFDPENSVALFVESDDPEAVDRAAFYYQAQVAHAKGLVSMPLDVFHRVAKDIPDPKKGFIFIHSVGRCGSTLLSKVMATVPAIHSLSEPDDLTQMVNLRGMGTPDGMLRELLASSVKWRAKPRLGPDFDYVAIKSRSEVMVLADLLGPLFPEAKHFFLYRDAVSWMGSLYRGYSPDRDLYDPERNREMEENWSNTIPLIRKLRREDDPMNPIEIRILAWITCMEGYLRLRELGIPTEAARFQDLTSQPVSILKQFFEFCGIGDLDWNAIDEALGRDSQAGTMYDREERRKSSMELTPELIQDVHKLVASRPLLRTTDVVLPGTMQTDLEPVAPS